MHNALKHHDALKQRFEQLFDGNFNRLMFHALRFVDDEAEAEDIVADVFVELWKKIDSIDLEMGITAYLYRAVTNRALNVLRHKNVAAVRIGLLETINEQRMEFIAADDDTEQNVVGADIGEHIRHALGELPEKCREVFCLSYINGLKNQEIADAMGVSVRTVEAHVYKALRLLREKLKYLVAILPLFLCM